ncbi:MAG: hypothetical protein OER80_00075 [Gammaproteobacteria bacterium]|nr:hypothetical protein [Gammaproteobacteria bacterium]MDH3767191.1 hypothetical protein [Gammaproteobacteria bacterium]
MKAYIEESIKDPVAGQKDHDRYLALFNKAQLYAFCNGVALTLAQRFLENKSSFDDADVVANDLNGLYIGETMDIPEYLSGV